MNLIEIKDNKKFMKALLMESVFDSFAFEEADITTYNHFYIDGHLVPAFYEQDNQDLALDESNTVSTTRQEFSVWENIRPICFQLMKGKRLPVQFKIVLHAPQDIVNTLLADETCSVSNDLLKALVITIKFNGSSTSCVSATAFYSFVMDKSMDLLWDQWLSKFIAMSDFA